MEANFKDLLGKTLSAVDASEYELIFITLEGEAFKLYHEQDCCENVYIEDIAGDLTDLIGSPILIAEESTNSKDSLGIAGNDESFTWTFYKLATSKGYVTIRWLGESNGYYSESVSFIKTDQDQRRQIII